jgi:hypothetical protein
MSTPTTPPAPYTPPPELLQRARDELALATKEELEGAKRCYESYNRPVEGRSAVTGAPLPSWEENDRPLVRWGWLEVYREEERHHLREVDSAVEQLRRVRQELLLHFLSDTRLPALVGESYLGVLRRMGRVDAEEVPTILLKVLAQLATEQAAELAELKACVGGLFNTLYEQGGLSMGTVALLHACAHHLRERGLKKAATLMEESAEGRAQVEAPLTVGLTLEERAVVECLVEARRNPHPTGLPWTKAQHKAAARLQQVAPRRADPNRCQGVASAREIAAADALHPHRHMPVYEGAKVLFAPPERLDGQPLPSRMTSPGGGPLPATVRRVYEDGKVDLDVHVLGARDYGALEVPFSEEPLPDGRYWLWPRWLSLAPSEAAHSPKE